MKPASRVPMALHWPVMEKGAAPARPMLPVSSARLLIALTVTGALRGVIDAHGPADEGGLGFAVESARVSEICSSVQPGDCGDVFRREGGDEGAKFFESGGVLRDVVVDR